MSITDSNNPCPQDSGYVFCPFQTHITAGHSNFQIMIPKPFLTGSVLGSLEQKRRQFYFAALSLIPDFFNRDAFLLNYDTTVDLALKLNYELDVRYEVSPMVYANNGELDVPRAPVEGMESWLSHINELSVNLKPQGMTRPPFFFDWIDMFNYNDMSTYSLAGNTEALEALISAEAIDYYGLEFDASVHSNKLPTSCKTVPGSNPYLLPNNTDFVEAEERLRLRLCVAPQTRVSIASQKMLEQLGFIGLSRSGRRYVFSNNESNGYKFFVADGMPNVKTRVDAGKMSVTPATTSFFQSSQLHLTGPDMRSNAALLRELKVLFKSLSDLTNIDLDVTYNNTTKLFNFQWPTHVGLNVTLTGNEELFETLGFGLVTFINKTSTPKEFSVNTKETSSKTKVLVMDTGQVIVTCCNAASNTASITSDQYMTSLFPHSAGKMEILYDNKTVSCVIPPAFETAYNNTVVLECKLWKFNDAGVMVPFNWVCGSVMTGILMGRL